MPAIYGLAERGRGAGREPPRCVCSTLSLCYSAIASSIFIFRAFIGSSNGSTEHHSFRARESLGGGDRPHRFESPDGSSGVARARVLYTGRRAACVGGT